MATATTVDAVSITVNLASASAWKSDKDLKPQVDRLRKEKETWRSTLILAFNALGVVYGDVGTSPLYVFSSTFTSQPTQDQIYGLTSIIFWLLTLICLVKYVLIVLRADHDGEGGTFALYSLLCRHSGIVPARPMGNSDEGHKDMMEEPPESTAWANSPKLLKRLFHAPSTSSATRHFFRSSKAAQLLLLLVAISASGLLLGDGIITPSISVLSAVGGLTNIPVQSAAAAINQKLITGVSCGILALLFLLQFNGTKRIGFSFSPIICVWLLSLLGMGVYNIHTYGGGSIFQALNPKWAFHFFTEGGTKAWLMLSGAILCVTGTEAMYADLGHFSARAINFAFILFVYPSLVITYLGQAAFLAANAGATTDYPPGPSTPFAAGSPATPSTPAAPPADASNAALYYGNAFWFSIPPSTGFLYFMLVVANLAAIIASQAVISGSFSIIRQAMSLGVCPRMRISHTSDSHEGQIYIAPINWFIGALCIIITAAFGINSTVLGEPIELANAYGVAVSGTMFLTTVLVTLVMIVAWEMNPLVAAAFFLFFGTLDGCLFAACLTKVPTGGWFPLIVAAFIVSISLAWWSGTQQKSRAVESSSTQLCNIIDISSHGTDREKDVAAGGDAGGGASSSSRYTTLHRSTRCNISRTPGLGIYYTDSEKEGTAPPIMVALIERLHVVHEVALIVTVRVLPIPSVPVSKRLLIRGVKDMPHFYQVVARYGYTDDIDHGSGFVNLIVASIHRSSAKGFLKRDSDFDARLPPMAEARDTDVEARDTGVKEPGSLSTVSVRSRHQGSALTRSSRQAEVDAQVAEDNISHLLSALRSGVVYLTPTARLQVDDSSVMTAFNSLSLNPLTWQHLPWALGGWACNVWYSTFYGLLETNAYYSASSWEVPQDSMMKLFVPVPLKL